MTFRRHLIFATLVGVYFAALRVLHLHFTVFTTEISDGMGIDLFLISAWCACYWQGPRTKAVIDPYPFRSGAILLGIIGMIGSLGLKIAAETP
jgi:hypothetical protein